MKLTKLTYFVAVLFTMVSTVFASAAIENTSLAMHCPLGHGIRVGGASYGKASEGCHAEITKDENTLKVARKCDLKRLCEVPATNDFFGDPCFGIMKVLNVEYECIGGIHSDETWEGGNVQLVACPREQVIKILRASYGRGECESQQAQHLVEIKCNGLQSCQVPATNDLFGDPCLNILKQLQVSYSCVNSVQPTGQILFREINKEESSLPS